VSVANAASAPELIDIVMPLREGRDIAEDVLRGVAGQDRPIRLWIGAQPTDGTADARNAVKAYGRTPYVLMLDADIVLLDGVLGRMSDFLDQHPAYGAIGLCRHTARRFFRRDEWLKAHHVDMSCVLFRRDVLSSITFADKYNASRVGREKLAGGCECANACYDIRRMGLQIGFLPEVYVRHVPHPPRN